MKLLSIWKKKIRKKGIISGHDYDCPDVKKAVDENFHKVELSGSVWWIEI